MTHRRTFSLLSLLSKPELTALGKYLQSPFFTNKKILYPLFLELRKAGALAADKPEPIFARVFPGETFQQHKWNRLLSDLNQCIEEFLSVRRLQTDADLYRQALVDVFFEQENESLFRQAVDAILQETAHPEKTEDWHLRFHTRKRALTYPLTNRLKLLANTFDVMEDDLERYYLISKLQFACNRASDSRTLRRAETQGYFSRLFEQLENADPNGESALLTLYRALLELLLDSGRDFPSFYTLLQEKGASVDRSEQETLARLSLNYCIARYRQGNKKAIEWCRQLFHWANEQQAWTKAAAEELFLNLGVLLAKTKQFREFDVFLKTRKTILPPERQEQAHNLLTAYNHFYRENFAAAAKALVLVDSRHPRYVLLAHSLRVRNMYSLWSTGQTSPGQLQLALHGFEDFLNRQKAFSESHGQSYRSLIWFIHNMSGIGNKGIANKATLLKELHRRPPAVRDWVESMIDRLPGEPEPNPKLPL